MVPKREVVFCGATQAAGDPRLFDVKTHIKYPMEGGTALITFEDEIGEIVSSSVGNHTQKSCSLCMHACTSLHVHLQWSTFPSLSIHVNVLHCNVCTCTLHVLH